MEQIFHCFFFHFTIHSHKFLCARWARQIEAKCKWKSMILSNSPLIIIIIVMRTRLYGFGLFSSHLIIAAVAYRIEFFRPTAKKLFVCWWVCYSMCALYTNIVHISCEFHFKAYIFRHFIFHLFRVRWIHLTNAFDQPMCVCAQN